MFSRHAISVLDFLISMIGIDFPLNNGAKDSRNFDVLSAMSYKNLTLSHRTFDTCRSPKVFENNKNCDIKEQG
jgi:hypothetical protein